MPCPGRPSASLTFPMNNENTTKEEKTYTQKELTKEKMQSFLVGAFAGILFGISLGMKLFR